MVMVVGSKYAAFKDENPSDRLMIGIGNRRGFSDKGFSQWHLPD